MTAHIDKEENRVQNIWKLLQEVKQWSVKYTTSFNNFILVEPFLMVNGVETCVKTRIQYLAIAIKTLNSSSGISLTNELLRESP